MITTCWKQDADCRPTFERARQHLAVMLENQQDPTMAVPVELEGGVVHADEMWGSNAGFTGDEYVLLA